jgi:hypothetical protein
MKSVLCRIVAPIPAIACLFVSSAHAQSITVQLGWGNITPCSTVEWTNDGILGTPSPTVRTAEQRVYAYATIAAPSASSIQNDLQQCAVQGAAAAGLSAIIASPAAAMPAFQAQFEGCMRARARNYFSLQLHLSEGQCMW